ncbi:histidine phosphotransferase ChpT [Ahrensia sp. R2A130]|uniref:histidine phosphotransferase ChpT n=1 Tax=Ahrensia sp. R2A130 TaxID=744979 RepID=UPI0001E0B52C|nr:histidine phosphotransferase family protein [Ahrensia sp. R2A130]EFL87792.1 putative Signal transduction histidine kinase [Ahrensia sp. R2A130]
MPELPKLSPLDLAALIASRVCHDIISPVGALANGLEVLEEEDSEEMKAFAMELIHKSAKTASAKLKFCRIAFGASGSAGSSIDTGEAEEMVGLYMNSEKAEYTWEGSRSFVPKNRVKLLLNLLLISLGAIPRGGNVGVQIHGEGETATFTLRCVGPKARVPADFVDMMNGTVEGDITAHAVQPYYTVMLAQDCGLELGAVLEGEDVVFTAK